MRKFIIRVLVEPKNKITYLYYVKENKFSSDINRAYLFDDIKSAYKTQCEFTDLECEIIEADTKKVVIYKEV